uniref:phosphatidate phosphatase n=1 Tax=Oryzias sinensis TaxID=183150 RepID=A0A8C7WX77_9TELE
MNYVGQLAGQVFVQVKELYRGLNPATLSGCIDVIVVRQPDGSLQCSPFHVRFGKMGVLRSREKVVDIEINGEPVSLHMKLGENGEAFFVKEMENKLDQLREDNIGELCYRDNIEDGFSMLSADSSHPVQSLGAQYADGGTEKKRRKRRRKARPEAGGVGGGGRREESGDDFSEDEDMFTIDLSSDDEKEGDNCRCYLFVHSSPDESPSLTPKSDSELTNRANPEMQWAWGELPQAAQVHTHKHTHVKLPSDHTTNYFWRKVYDQIPLLSIRVSASIASYSPHPEETAALEKDKDKENGDREIENIGSSYTETNSFAVCSATKIFPDHLDEGRNRGSPIIRTDSPSRKKEKRSQHLGADGIYLDDIAELEPEVAALYFPKSSMKGESELMMMDVRSANQSPQSVSSSGVDSGIDSLLDQISDLPHVAISLCGGLTDNKEITREQFMERTISYQQFSENPSIIDDPNLVVKIGNKYYNWSTAAPVMLAMQVYKKPLPQESVENIMKEKMPKKGGRWWFSWRSRNTDSKSVREKAASLQLKEGPNEVVFSVTTQYQGTCRCHGTIYLWSWNDKIVISDIDGTITRSDTLGHILPTLGKDWTHQGIARLYHRVSLNGYKFMYCSARAIGMADMTRGYLHWVNERGTMLPMGPVLLSPSSLFSAFHREVIEKKPEKFKIECLTDIKHLFYPNSEPFYAAFGNRATDVYSYKEVGIPLNRIFTVNPKGELVQEHAKTNVSSFVRLCDMVDHVFPALESDGEANFSHPDTSDECNSWNKELCDSTSRDKEEDLQGTS